MDDRVKRQKAIAIIKSLRKQGVGDGLLRDLDQCSSGEMYRYLLRGGYLWAKNQNNFVKQLGLPLGGMMEKIELNKIRLDGGTQSRAEMNMTTVEEYAEAMKEGAQFPPVIVIYDGTDHWLGDGFHRHAAAKKAELPEIAAEVRQGTRRDAVLLSVSVNANHGLRRTNADKRRAIETLLRDDDWREWSDKEIGRKVSVDNHTVAKVRAELVQRGEIPRLETRKVERSGEVYEVTQTTLPPTISADVDAETARLIALDVVTRTDRDGVRERLESSKSGLCRGVSYWMGANVATVDGQNFKISQKQIGILVDSVNGTGLFRFDAYQLFDWAVERDALVKETDVISYLLRLALKKSVYVQSSNLAKRLVKYGLAMVNPNNTLTITADGRQYAEVIFQNNPLRALEREILLSIDKDHHSMVPFIGERALIGLYDRQAKNNSWVWYSEYEDGFQWSAEFAKRGYTVGVRRETRGAFEDRSIMFYHITPAGSALIGREPLPTPEPLPELPYHVRAHVFIEPDATFKVQVGDRIRHSNFTGVVTELKEYPLFVYKRDVMDSWNSENTAFDHEVEILKRAGEYQDEPASVGNEDFVIMVGDRVEYRDWGMYPNAEGKLEYGMKWVPVVVVGLGTTRISIRHTSNHRNNDTQWAEKRSLRPVAAQFTQAPAGQSLKQHDMVMTRTGHPGQILSISGRMARVQTAHLLSEHKLETLTKIEGENKYINPDVMNGDSMRLLDGSVVKCYSRDYLRVCWADDNPSPHPNPRNYHWIPAESVTKVDEPAQEEVPEIVTTVNELKLVDAFEGIDTIQGILLGVTREDEFLEEVLELLEHARYLLGVRLGIVHEEAPEAEEGGVSLSIRRFAGLVRN